MLSSVLHIKKPCFSQNKFYYRVSVLEQPEETYFLAILTVDMYLVSQTYFTVKCTVLHAGTACDAFIEYHNTKVNYAMKISCLMVLLIYDF